jgi:hypothetical protein
LGLLFKLNLSKGSETPIPRTAGSSAAIVESMTPNFFSCALERGRGWREIEAGCELYVGQAGVLLRSFRILISILSKAVVVI